MTDHTNPLRPSGPGQTILFTVGYAGHDRDSLLAVLRAQSITAVADIRTFKRSSYWTAFDSDAFGPWLREHGIAYVFLGDLLGGKPQDETLYPDGQLDYQMMAARPAFQTGIQRLIDGAKRYRICLMCAEKDPLDCHRTLAIAPLLQQAGFVLRHILADGTVEDQSETDARMIAINGGETPDLFATQADDPDAERALALKRQITKVAPKAVDAIKRR
jgi:uncharacterized protein (DUF488 family)